jgi:formate-dependent nitrite reductase membrane component NrfD
MSEYNIFPQLAFSWLNVTYFFLGGLSAGCYFFSVAANYWKKEFKPLAKTGAILSPLFLAIGMFCLLIEVGHPLRTWRLFLTFNPRSAISWGIWFLNIFFLLSIVYAWFLTKEEDEKAKKYAYLGLPFALLVATYTGVLLAQSPGKMLWHTALLPWLFLVGGLISGIALVILVSVGRQDSELLAKLGRFVAWLILLELGMILTEVIVLFNGGTEAVTAVKSLLGGPYSFLFWLVEIILGAVIPVFILLQRKVTTTAAQAVASMLILIGIYAMRYVVMIGGQII